MARGKAIHSTQAGSARSQVNTDAYRAAEPIEGVTEGRHMGLVVALLHILRTKELSHVSVTAVAEEAGVNRQTFYNYFRNIEDLARYITEGVGGKYAAIIANDLVEHGNLDEFYAFKKASIEYFLFFYRELAYTKRINKLYENIFYDIIERLLAHMEDAGARLSERQRYALKAVVYNIMALFSDWEMSEKTEGSMSIDDLIEFFKWASEPLVECVVENRGEWSAVGLNGEGKGKKTR